MFATELSMALTRAGFDSRARSLVAGPTGTLPVEPLGTRGRSPSTLWRLRHELHDRDLLITYGAATLSAGALASIGGPPMIYRGIGDPRFWGQVRASGLRIGLPLKAAQAVVTLWPAAGEALVELYGLHPDRLHTIPNGRDPDRFAPADAATRFQARQLLGLPADGPIVGYVGSLAWEKQPLVAIEAVRQVPGATLVLAGGGPLRAEVEARAAEIGPSIRILGSVADTTSVYHAIDALILPSRTEGMPGVVIEAGLSGVPSVATDVGGTSELVSPVTGALVATGEPDELAESMAESLSIVLADAEARGRAARELCLAHHTIGGVVAQWETLIATVGDAAVPTTKR